MSLMEQETWPNDAARVHAISRRRWQALVEEAVGDRGHRHRGAACHRRHQQCVEVWVGRVEARAQPDRAGGPSIRDDDGDLKSDRGGDVRTDAYHNSDTNSGTDTDSRADPDANAGTDRDARAHPEADRPDGLRIAEDEAFHHAGTGQSRPHVLRLRQLHQ